MKIYLDNISIDDVKEGINQVIDRDRILFQVYNLDTLRIYSTLLINSALKSIILKYDKNKVAVKNFDMKDADSFLQLVEGIYEFDKLYIKDSIFIPVLVRINPVLYTVLLFSKSKGSDKYIFIKYFNYFGFTYKTFSNELSQYLYRYAYSMFEKFFPNIPDSLDAKLTNRLVNSVIRGYRKVYNYNFYRKYFNDDIETFKDFSYLVRSLQRLKKGTNVLRLNFISFMEFYYPATHLFLCGLIYDKQLIKNLNKNLSYFGLVQDTHPLLYHYLKHGELPGTLPEWKYISKRINTIDYRVLSILSGNMSLHPYERMGNEHYLDSFYYEDLKSLEGRDLTYQDIIDFFINTLEKYNVQKRSPLFFNNQLVSGKYRIKSNDRYEVTFKIELFMRGTHELYRKISRGCLLFDKIDMRKINLSPESLKAASRYFRKITGMRARYYPVWEFMIEYINDAVYMYDVMSELYDELEIRPYSHASREEVESVRELYTEVGNRIKWLHKERSKLKPTFKSMLEFSKKVHDVDVKLQLLSSKVDRLNRDEKIYKPIMPLIDSLKELKPYWISTSEEIEHKGIMYEHCLWSYASTAESNAVWFFDYNKAVAHVEYNSRTDELVLVQCYSPGNRETATSRNFAKRVKNVLNKANRSKKKLQKEVMKGLNYLQQNKCPSLNNSPEHQEIDLAIPA